LSVPATAQPRDWLRDHGLAIVAFSLYALTHLGAAIAGWITYLDEQQQHGEPATILGDGGYGWVFLEQTLQNWQSEFLVLGVLVVLSAMLLHLGSKQSREGNDEAQARVRAIEDRVQRLVAARASR
jgi:hypothetical protein